MPPTQSKTRRISPTAAILMLAVAALYDLLQAGINLLQGINAVLPGLGAFIVFLLGLPLTIWAWLTFYVWFKMYGISFVKPKRFAIISICGIADTFLSVLPAWVAAVALLIITIRGEEILEKAGPLGTLASKALASKTQGGLGAARGKRIR